MQTSNCSTRSSSYTVHFYTFAITGWLSIRSNDSSSSRIPFASHETYTWSMCPASTSTLLLPVPLGVISRLSGSSTLTRREKNSIGCGASRSECCECRINYSCFYFDFPFSNLARESGLMSNYICSLHVCHCIV